MFPSTINTIHPIPSIDTMPMPMIMSMSMSMSPARMSPMAMMIMPHAHTHTPMPMFVRINPMSMPVMLVPMLVPIMFMSPMPMFVPRMSMMMMVMMMRDHRAILIEFDAPWKGPGTLRRGQRPAGRDISLLVIRVLFKLFVISIVQYLELFLYGISACGWV